MHEPSGGAVSPAKRRKGTASPRQDAPEELLQQLNAAYLATRAEVPPG